jgi:transcriptional regulator with XRE-family HTH domain
MNLAGELELFNNLASNLRHLIKRSNINEAELARKTNIPQPTLHKILTGKTVDPRASTLKSLAEFFQVTIDDLLSGTFSHASNPLSKTQSIAVISWSDCIKGKWFLKELTPNNWNQWLFVEYISEHAFGLLTRPSMEPRFPKNTTLIIDPEVSPEDGDLVIVHYPNTTEATLREFSIDGPIKLLKPINHTVSSTDFDLNIKILGVVVQAKFYFGR